MDELSIGIRVVVTDARTLGAIGIAHVPRPVRPGDLIAFREGNPWRVLALLPTAPGATLRVLADEVTLAITGPSRSRGIRST
jgi:hypothetical protein